MSISPPPFLLAPQIQADTCPVCELPLCTVLLSKNAAWPWLILVPRRQNLTEITDLSPQEQLQLWPEINLTAATLKQLTSAHKLNIANLGNIVSQLHIHVVARKIDDPAWPSPIWGSGHSSTYSEEQKDKFISQLQEKLKLENLTPFC